MTLIFYVEENARYLSSVEPFFDAIDRGELRAVSSTITLTEVLVHPIRSGDVRLRGEYRRILLNSTSFSIISASTAIAEDAARLRAEFNLRTPDAIQLATAVASGAAAFLTNDARLPALPGLRLLLLDDLRSSSGG